MMFTKNYQNWSTLAETTDCQSWRVFVETQCIYCAQRAQTTAKAKISTKSDPGSANIRKRFPRELLCRL